MAGKKTSALGANGLPPGVTEDDVLEAAYKLAFHLARCESYHGMEARFYTFMTRMVLVVSLISGTSSFVAMAGFLSPSIALPLAAAMTFLIIVNHAADFRGQMQLHINKKAEYAAWANELRAHATDWVWLKRMDDKMNAEWAARTYSERWAIEALSWNDAVLQTHNPNEVTLSELYEVWWTEHLLGHVISFSREHFARRRLSSEPISFFQHTLWGSAYSLFAAGLFATFLYLSYWAYNYGASMTPGYAALFWLFNSLLLFASFFLADAGYHRSRRAREMRRMSGRLASAN